MMIRTFVALEIPVEALKDILSIRDHVVGSIRKVKWEPIDKLHVTFKFLGDTEESSIRMLSEELENILSGRKILNLVFNKFGVFRKGNDPKILWAGLNPNSDLSEIVGKIEESFVKFGYEKKKRKFSPHITLLRFRGYEDSGKICKLLDVQLPKIDFTANTIHLMKSELKQSGSVYTTLQKFILNK